MGVALQHASLPLPQLKSLYGAQLTAGGEALTSP